MLIPEPPDSRIRSRPLSEIEGPESPALQTMTFLDDQGAETLVPVSPSRIAAQETTM